MKSWRMKSAVTGLGAALLAVALVVPGSLAQSGPPRQGQGGGGPGGGWRPDPQRMVDRSKQQLEGLNLSEEQQKKIDEIYASATAELATLRQEWDKNDVEPRQRMQALSPVMENVRNQVSAVLTAEQLEQYQKRVDEDRNRWQRGGQGGGPGGPGGPPGGQGGGFGGGMFQGAMIDRMREGLDQLQLTDEQKQQALQALDEASERFEQIRQQAMQTTEQTRDKLNQILGEEQMQKLQEQMRQGWEGFRRGEGGREGGRGPRDGQGQAGPPAQDMP